MRLDAIAGVLGKDKQKTYWTKIGSAFPSKFGSGYTLFLDYLPLHRSEDGKVVIVLSEPKERDAGGGGRPQPQRQRDPGSRGPADDMDDGMPF
jgi:hypothetical protein